MDDLDEFESIFFDTFFLFYLWIFLNRRFFPLHIIKQRVQSIKIRSFSENKVQLGVQKDGCLIRLAERGAFQLCMV